MLLKAYTESGDLDSVKFDGEFMDNFTVDFSGPYVRIGSYLKF